MQGWAGGTGLRVGAVAVRAGGAVRPVNGSEPFLSGFIIGEQDDYLDQGDALAKLFTGIFLCHASLPILESLYHDNAQNFNP